MKTREMQKQLSNGVLRAVERTQFRAVHQARLFISVLKLVSFFKFVSTRDAVPRRALQQATENEVEMRILFSCLKLDTA
jgi:hypothetical protein